MRRSRLVGTVVVLVAASGAIANAVPHGKVVRVERGRPHGAPGLCEMTGEDGAHCYFRKPEIGEMIEMLGTQRVIGEYRVTSVVDPESCGAAASMWTVEVELVHGDNAGRSETVAGVYGLPIDDATARVFSEGHLPPPPTGNRNEQVAVALDRNGDGQPDFEVSFYICDAQGAVIDLANGPGAGLSCLALWIDDGHGLRRNNLMIVQNCS